MWTTNNCGPQRNSWHVDPLFGGSSGADGVGQDRKCWRCLAVSCRETMLVDPSWQLWYLGALNILSFYKMLGGPHVTCGLHVVQKTNELERLFVGFTYPSFILKINLFSKCKRAMLFYLCDWNFAFTYFLSGLWLLISRKPRVTWAFKWYSTQLFPITGVIHEYIKITPATLVKS